MLSPRLFSLRASKQASATPRRPHLVMIGAVTAWRSQSIGFGYQRGVRLITGGEM
jgi:hypothetical protein